MEVRDVSREPVTAAGRRLFTDNDPMDMLESDGVTWNDILAIEDEARSLPITYRPAPTPERHEPGDFHQYGPPVCEVCGQEGTLTLSAEPQRAPQEPGQ